MNYLERVANPNNLYEAFKKASKGSNWKLSVQRYEANLLTNIRKTELELLDGSYKQGPFLEFEVNERGHNRQIKAPGIADRVVQGSLCNNVLLPELRKYLIYDNGASLKNKGVDFSRRRLETHLRKYYRHFGNEGYFLHIDFRKFFDNIRHDKLLEMFEEKLGDDSVMPLIRQIVESFKVDISYADHDLTDEVFNSMEYAKIPKEKKTGERFMHKSLGIGSQVSQVVGIFFPTRVDTYCKVVRGCKYYGRYMDDIYIIHPDKDFLKSVLTGVRKQAAELGLFINEKKTQMFKLSHGFTFLKIKYNLTETGKIIKRPARENITRQRRKMKKFKYLVAEGKMTRKDAEEEVKSWLGSMKKLNAYRTCQNIRELWWELFGSVI